LHEEAIAELQESRFSIIAAWKNEEDRKCLICTFDYEEGELMITTQCLHKYNKECMLDWTKRQDFCPIDRIPIDVEIVFD
jgi:hypothetical protein